MKSTCLAVLCIVAIGITLFSVAPASANANRSYAEWKASHNDPSRTVVASLCNSVVCVQIDETGEFNIGTPDDRTLLYFYPSDPWSSDIRVRVDGVVYNLGGEPGATCDGSATFVSYDANADRIDVHYTILDNIHVHVIHTVVAFSGTTGAVLTRTTVSNMSTAPHMIGVLYEYDTTVDGDDAAELYYGPTHLLNETCYDFPFDVTYWDAIPESGTLVGRGTFVGGAAVVPDHIAFGQWGDFYGTCWGRVCDNEPYGDSAVLYQWDEADVPAGGERSVATYYGVGELQIQPGDLQVSVSLPPLACEDGVVTPDPFEILVNITNTGGSTCNNISLDMSEGAGPGGTATITSTNPQVIGSLGAGDNAARSFTADLSAVAAGGCVNFTVNVTSENCESNALTFCVEVPPCSQEDCEFPYTRVDMGDLHRCNYPTLVRNPGHALSGIAWLGETITGEVRPDIFNQDAGDDGVTFVGLPWMPCTEEQVIVTVTAGPEYDRYVACGGQLYLTAWKDGNIDGDFCDELCDGRVSEWMIQDMVVTPGVWTINVMDPGVFDLDVYDGAFRFRLTSQPLGRFGFGAVDVSVCPECVCGGRIGFDMLGEVEDYYIPDAQLAVELADFHAITQGSDIDLTWRTVSETGNAKFEIARDGLVIGEVATLGNGPEGHTYRFTDNNVPTGVHSYTLWSISVTGIREELRTVEATPDRAATVVTEYALFQNYPNPFNPTTSIRMDLLESGFVTLKVFNPIGQEVATIANGQMSAGTHLVSFDASSLPAGVYLYRVEVNGYSATKKMLLLK